jgi:hypothetical protein
MAASLSDCAKSEGEQKSAEVDVVVGGDKLDRGAVTVFERATQPQSGIVQEPMDGEIGRWIKA